MNVWVLDSARKGKSSYFFSRRKAGKRKSDENIRCLFVLYNSLVKAQNQSLKTTGETAFIDLIK
ncbi:hypothetical protein RTE01_38240 [Raoultella terrigena]|nr:hypothetical protein RTE01_38240 [Raoultella terrigena]